MTASDARPARRAPAWVAPGYALLLTLVVLAPLLPPGYLLIRDAVSTPRSFVTDGALGIGESAPRAVPQDFAVAVLSSALDGGAVVKTLLLAGLFLAGLGASRLAALLLPESGLPGQLVSATVAVWNPFVAERLLQGHWSLLLAYGCLPWVAAAVHTLRTADPDAAGSGATRWAGLVLWIAVAGLTPTGVVMAAAVALVSIGTPGAGVPRARCALGVLVTAGLAASPWLTAALIGGSLAGRQSAGVDAFAARAEPFLGTLGSLAGLGGIWNSEAVPGSRTTGFAVFGTVVLLAVVLCGVPLLFRRRIGVPLLALAAAAVVLPAALATGPGLAVLRAVVDAVPGLALLRDGQKWVALAMPGYALAAAATVVVLRRWMRPVLTAALCCVAMLVGLPDLMWGVGGQLRSVQYPRGWQEVANRMNAAPGTVAVLPSETMRQFGWAGAAPVLDPLPRWVRAETLSTGDLRVGGLTVPGEGTRAREVQALLEAGADTDELARAGVGWLVIEHGTPGTVGSATADRLSRLRPDYSDGDITLYRVSASNQVAPQEKRVAALVAHLVWAAILVGSTAVLAWGRRSIRT